MFGINTKFTIAIAGAKIYKHRSIVSCKKYVKPFRRDLRTGGQKLSQQMPNFTTYVALPKEQTYVTCRGTLNFTDLHNFKHNNALCWLQLCIVDSF